MPRKKIKKTLIKNRRRTVRKSTKLSRKREKNSPLGSVTHYFDKINVAVVKLFAPLKVGDYVEFRKGEEHFNQIIESMQVDHKNILAARVKSEVGLKVIKEVKEGWEMRKLHQPTLLEIPKKEEPPKKEIEPLVCFSDKSREPVMIIKRRISIENPIASKALESRPKSPFIVKDLKKDNNSVSQRDSSQNQLAQTPPVINKPKKKGYGEVKFLKF
ncbi:hypothetical protein A2230_05690 [candidate division WOR-1 bacterium RIFOXYA2_FULL_36_21]|uniref:Uncharacterized protein n=1 Tax=candidate division WOR-1 bacterium RIFOXYB2_FULL_36_35 TaxID=1802578 RepID=A0A1F4S5A6_UNCSA|nr:MAG: hypothetical protein A2230_05690 [candidate division WOR-1 bacterium RIFOXYA2_FULL_36_21]OGC15106.1 MAG: hypothetical protein A2282_04655 [candidate division WOR-1 bacterium RIFOXYA12_FULL_36_13]OGC15547.1 MAG: hypothetical protein A2290_04085 [candidate division WOR-1 bacterium RIFOXYB2_FULL_36_35]